MKRTIGIRREDKNEWERRAPLTPQDVAWLRETHGIETVVQPSDLRIFPDSAYREAGAVLNEDLSAARVVLAIKEIPGSLLEAGKVYLFFSHTIKGQPHNMGMLGRLVERRTSLIDYERIVDDAHRRLLFFGRYAGLAGMIETLHAVGRKMDLQGYDTPLSRVQQPFRYPSLEAAREEITRIGDEIADRGLPTDILPLVVGFAGYGNVSRGAQEIFDLLPHKVISPLTLEEMAENFSGDAFNFYKVVFQEEDMVRPLKGGFDLQEYYRHPERYAGDFEKYLRYLRVLVNCIYWTEAYPRLVTKEYLKNATVLRSHLNLQVIGDISCDIDGSIEITRKATMPDNPCFTYFADRDAFEDGVQRLGVSVMAVDNLPCEFPAESSSDFSAVLRRFVADTVDCDYGASLESLALAPELKRALILKQGVFTPDYAYMKEFLT